MTLKENVLLKSIILLLISITFFLGYFLRENSAGGGKEFYELSWPIIQSFKEDFLYTIKNYGKFRDFTIPFSHILNAYLNPFSDNIKSFQLFNTFISFSILFIFTLAIKKYFINIKSIDLLITSSVLLLLPFFRTSAFWGKNENYGWLFLILAIFFFIEIKKNLTSNPNRKDLINIILFCFLSSCALYARQALVFLPISYLLYLFIYKANKKIILVSIVSFIVFALPSLYLISIWGNVFDTRSLGPGNFFGWWINPNHILKNIPILFSYFGFYLLPFLIIEIFDSGFKNFYYKYFKSFLLSFVAFIILSFSGLLSYLGDYTIAGGGILKLNYLIQKNNYFLLLIFSSIGISIFVRLFLDDRKNNLIFLIPMILIYCFPKLLYQEYFEPLILILFFLVLNTDIKKVFFKNISLSNLVFLSYFAIYLISSIYFKHFAFDTYEKWLLFLKAS
tara:strand:- start:4425 stop:5771 length:1347 start_codon:yes stop_codon:yes gene_type:complete